MRSLLFFSLVALGLFSASTLAQQPGLGQPTPLGLPNTGAYSPSYYSPSFNGLGAFGNGIYGPGYYGPGYLAPGVNGYQPSGAGALGVDPSMYFHTYPSSSAPSLRPFLPGSGLPSLQDGVYGAPLLRSTTVTWPSRGKITINLPADAPSDIPYTLNGAKYLLKPGYLQTFDDDRKWIMVAADQAFKKRYLLTAGNYRFYKFDSGWELREVIDKPAAAKDTPSPSVAR